MTDKKFKDQLIHLIKNDSEVRTLILELAKDEIEDQFVEFFMEKERLKYEEASITGKRLSESTLKNQLDSYFYYLAREIENKKRDMFIEEINKELEDSQNIARIEFELYVQDQKDIENEIKELEEAHLSLIPKSKIKNRASFEKIFNYLVKHNMLEGNLDHFIFLCEMRGVFVELNWIDKKGYNNKSKNVTYVLLFDLMHNIIFCRPNAFEDKTRKIFLTNIMEGIKFNGKRCNYNSLNTAYSSWSNKNSLIAKII